MPSSDGHLHLFDPADDTHNGAYDGEVDIHTYGSFGGTTMIVEFMSKEEWEAFSKSDKYKELCKEYDLDPDQVKKSVDKAFGRMYNTQTGNNTSGDLPISNPESTTDKLEKAKKWAEDAEDLYLTGLISKEEYEKAKFDYEKAKGEYKVEKAKKWAQDAEDLYITGLISKDEFEKAKEAYKKANEKTSKDVSGKSEKTEDQASSTTQKSFAEQVADYIGEKAQTQTTDMTHNGETESMIVITDDSAALHMEIRDFIDDMQKSGKTEVEYKEIINDDGSKVTVITFKEPPPPPEEEGDGEGGGGDADSNVQKGIDKGKKAAEGGKKL